MSKVSKQQLYLLIIFLILFLVSAFRNGLGTDYPNYVKLFNNPSIPEADNFSFLFKAIFCYGLKFITTDSVFFFIVTSFVINFFIIKTIYYRSSIIWVSVILYVFLFYLSTFNIIRQFLAISLFYYFGLNYVQNNKMTLYIILLLLLAQIHFSVYILVLFLFLKDKKRTITFYMILWGISIIIVIFKEFQVMMIDSTLKLIAKMPLVPSGLVDYSLYNAVFINLSKTNYQLIIKNLLLVILFLNFNKIYKKTTILYFNLFFFGIIIGNIFNIFNQLGPRLAYYGEFSLILLIPEYIDLFKTNSKKIATLLFLGLFMSYGFYRFYLNNESAAIPNEWRFNKR